MTIVNVNYNESGIVCFMNINGGNADDNNYSVDDNIFGGTAVNIESEYNEILDGGKGDSQYYNYDCMVTAPVSVNFDKVSPEEFVIDLTYTDGIVTLENLSIDVEKFKWLVSSPTLTEVYLGGIADTVIPVGSKIKSNVDATSHIFMESITLDNINISTCAITLNEIGVENEHLYQLTISDENNENPITYGYTSSASATLEEIIEGLSIAITWVAMDKYTTPENYLVLTCTNANFSIDYSDSIYFEFYNIANVRAVIEGESTVEAGDLSIIEDVISGFNTVFNLLPGVTGHTFTEDKTDLTNFIFDLDFSGYYTVELTGYNALDEIVDIEKKVDYITGCYSLV